MRQGPSEQPPLPPNAHDIVTEGSPYEAMSRPQAPGLGGAGHIPEQGAAFPTSYQEQGAIEQGTPQAEAQTETSPSSDPNTAVEALTGATPNQVQEAPTQSFRERWGERISHGVKVARMIGDTVLGSMRNVEAQGEEGANGKSQTYRVVKAASKSELLGAKAENDKTAKHAQTALKIARFALKGYGYYQKYKGASAGSGSGAGSRPSTRRR